MINSPAPSVSVPNPSVSNQCFTHRFVKEGPEISAAAKQSIREEPLPKKHCYTVNNLENILSDLCRHVKTPVALKSNQNGSKGKFSDKKKQNWQHIGEYNISYDLVRALSGLNVGQLM